MTEGFKNEIAVLRGPDRIRKRPAVVFGFQGDEGVKNYVKMLLDTFITETAAGYCDKIEINLHKDLSLEIISYDSGIVLSKEINDGKAAWQSLFCDLYCEEKFADMSYYDKLTAEHNDIYGREGSKLRFGVLDGPQFALCCIQYASSFMYVEAVRDGIKNTVEFSKGYSVSELKKERTDKPSYTRIHCKPDPEVFGEYGAMNGICSQILKGLSVTVPAFNGVLYDEAKEIRTEFNNTLNDYTGPVYRAEISCEGKDRYNYNTYLADVKLTLAFSENKNEIACYHNCRLLECGGTHLEKAIERVCTYTGYCLWNTENGNKVTEDDILPHLCLVLESGCDYSVTKWQNAARKSIENRMIEDMTYDLFGEKFRSFLNENIDEISKILLKE